MFNANVAILAGSILLFALPVDAGPLDLLFGAEQNTAAADAAPASVKKLGDSELSCAQIYAEVGQLEALMAKSQPASEAGKAMASGLAQGLLQAIPLFGGRSGAAAAGIVASQAASGQAQQAERAYIDAATAAQRRDHLVELFEQKRCKVSELKK